MRQRGRKSAALLSFPEVDGGRPRITPPASLTKAERFLFIELAADAPHLVPADAPLLGAYCQAVLLSRRTGRDPVRVEAWERATRVMTSLATKLRLTPQARTCPKSIGRQQQGPASYYDRRDDD